MLADAYSLRGVKHVAQPRGPSLGASCPLGVGSVYLVHTRGLARHYSRRVRGIAYWRRRNWPELVTLVTVTSALPLSAVNAAAVAKNARVLRVTRCSSGEDGKEGLLIVWYQDFCVAILSGCLLNIFVEYQVFCRLYLFSYKLDA